MLGRRGLAVLLLFACGPTEAPRDEASAVDERASRPSFAGRLEADQVREIQAHMLARTREDALAGAAASKE